MKKSLVVNLFGGPGTGKSTMAADIFTCLKRSQVRCELATEYAKDLVWAGLAGALDDQIYVFAKQNHRIHVLMGKVDVIICDSPLLVSGVYARPHMDHLLYMSFDRLVRDVFTSMWNLNIYITRDTVYDTAGRIETLAGAMEIDNQMIEYLNAHKIVYSECNNTPANVAHTINRIRALVGQCLQKQWRIYIAMQYAIGRKSPSD